MSKEGRQIRIVGFMPTPFAEDGRIDTAALESLSKNVASEGIHPAVLGGMGEYYALDRHESRDCVAAAISGAGGVPVVTGIGGATREAARFAADAGELGVGTLVINPPNYVKPPPQAYAEHVRHITEAAGVGAIVYSSTDYPMTDAHLECLVEIEGFHGVKEEHYGAAETAKRIVGWGERIQWWGVGELNGAEYARVGANTVTSSLCNVRADLAVRAISALVDGHDDHEAVQAAQDWLVALTSERQGSAAFLTEVMHRVAGWNRSVRLPMLPSDSNGQTTVETFLHRWALEQVGLEIISEGTR